MRQNGSLFLTLRQRQSNTQHTVADRPILLSAAMIVKDEEKYLPGCLESLVDLVDEIVIVDTGSTDRTVEIAKSYGARVLHSKWRNDFSYHRNEAIAAAKGLWIFICDADEVVVDTDVNETRFHLEHSPLNPILMATQRLLYPDGKKINMLAPRIFRSDLNIRYTYPIHEQLDVDETSATLSNVTLLHRGYEDEETLEAKERRNLEIAMTMEDSPHASHCRARAALSLRDWQKVVEAAHGLTGDKVPTAVCVEGCVLGAAASFNLSNRDDFNLFLEAARKRVPDSPDVRFMELILAGQKYLESLSTVLTISSSR